MALVAGFFFRHSETTFAALADILQLLNTIVPGCIVSTLYRFKKLFFDTESVLMHFYCAHCETYLGTEEKTYLCSGCKRQIRFEECKRLKCFFLTTSIENQLRDLLVGTSIFSKIMSGKKKLKVKGKGKFLLGMGTKIQK